MSFNDQKQPDAKPSLKRVHEEEEEEEQEQPEDTPAKRGLSSPEHEASTTTTSLQQQQSNMNTPNSMAAAMAANNAAAFHLLANGPLFGGPGGAGATPFPPPPNHPAMAAAIAAANVANGAGQAQQDGQAAALHALFGAHGPNGGVPFGVYPPAMRQDLLGPMAGYYLESAAGFHPYGMDAGRRKNATREVTLPLKQWLNEHRKNPYPTKAEKTILAIITKMTMTQVSTWFANARRRLKKEHKMTWSPRNRQADDEDEDDDEDDEICRNERPSSSVSVLSDEPRRESLLMEQHMNRMNGVGIDMVSEQKPVRPSDETSSPRKKIWSIAETLNQQRTTSSSSSSAADDFKETKAVDLTSATNTSSSSSSLSPPRPPLIPGTTSNPSDYTAFAAALAAATPQMNDTNGGNGVLNPFLQPPHINPNAAAAAMMPGFPFSFIGGPNPNPVFASLAAAAAQQGGQVGGVPSPQQFMALIAQQQQHQQHQQQHIAHMMHMMAAAAASTMQQQHNHRMQSPAASNNPMAAMAAMSGSALTSPIPTSKPAQIVLSSKYSDASTPHQQQNNAGIQRRASSSGFLNPAGSPTTSKPKDKPVNSPPPNSQLWQKDEL